MFPSLFSWFRKGKDNVKPQRRKKQQRKKQRPWNVERLENRAQPAADFLLALGTICDEACGEPALVWNVNLSNSYDPDATHSGLINGAELPAGISIDQSGEPIVIGNAPDPLNLVGCATGEHFPWPADAGGDVKNFLPGCSGNDSIWIDLGFPVRATPDGRAFKPLFAFHVEDLDNRIHVNAHVMTGGEHGSYQGWGRWELAVSATDVIASDLAGHILPYFVFGVELPAVQINEALTDGLEVVVSFRQGDINQPVVVGDLFQTPGPDDAPQFNPLSIDVAVQGKTDLATEIKDFSLGVENPTTIGSATGGAGAGKIKFNEFPITKTTDSASPVFFKNCCAGAHYSTVIIDMRKAGGDPKSAGQPFLKFKFDTVFTTKIDWSGPGDESPEESITFVYGKLGAALDCSLPDDGQPPDFVDQLQKLAQIDTEKPRPPLVVFTWGQLTFQGLGETLANFVDYIDEDEIFTPFNSYLVAIAPWPHNAPAQPTGEPPVVSPGDDVMLVESQSLSRIAAFTDDYSDGNPGPWIATVGDGDGEAEIVTGPGAPFVKVFHMQTHETLAGLPATYPDFQGGVRVAVGDVNGDGRDDIITAAGPVGGPHVQMFDGASLAAIDSIFADDLFGPGGLFVAGSR